MAGKGNYIALQQLKPVKYDVGEYSVKLQDWLIQRGDAQEAIKVKRVADEKKYWNEKADKIKVDPTFTRQNFQQGLDKLYNGVIDLKDQALRASNDPNLTNEDKQKVLSSATKAESDYKLYATTLGSKEFLDNVTKSEAFIADGNADLLDPKLAQRKAMQLGIFDANISKDGSINFSLPKQDGSNESVEYGLYDIRDNMMSMPQLDVLRDTKAGGKGLYSVLADTAKDMTTEYDNNTNGNRTVTRKQFAIGKGKVYADTVFGNDFNPNVIDNRLNAFYRAKNGGNNIETPEQFSQAKTAIVDYMASLVPDESKVDTKYTDAQLAKQKQDLVNAQLEAQEKKANIAYKNAQSKFLKDATQQTSELVPNFIAPTQIKDPKTGKVTGVQNQETNVVMVKRSDGKTTTSVPFGVSVFRNKNNQIVTQYKVGTISENGNLVYSKLDRAEYVATLRGMGQNPMDVDRKLKAETLTPVRYGDLPKIDYLSSDKDVKINPKGKNYNDTGDGNDWTLKAQADFGITQ